MICFCIENAFLLLEELPQEIIQKLRAGKGKRHKLIHSFTRWCLDISILSCCCYYYFYYYYYLTSNAGVGDVFLLEKQILGETDLAGKQIRLLPHFDVFILYVLCKKYILLSQGGKMVKCFSFKVYFRGLLLLELLVKNCFGKYICSIQVSVQA